MSPAAFRRFVSVCCHIVLFAAFLSVSAVTRATAGPHADGELQPVDGVVFDSNCIQFFTPHDNDPAQVEQAGVSIVPTLSSSDTKALEETGAALMRDGRFRDADRVYSRLLKLALGKPAEAVRYAFIKWHLRQGYEAQASMIRAARSGGFTVDDAELVQKTLADAYDEKNVILSIRREFNDPADSGALANLELYWEEVCQTVRRFEVGKDSAGLKNYIGGVLGDKPVGMYHAIWRGFALLNQGVPDEAVVEFNIALDAGPDTRSGVDIAAGLQLVRESGRSALAIELLDRLSGVVSGISSSMGEQISDSYVTTEETFEKTEALIRDRDFAAAAGELDTLHSVFLDIEQRAKYLYLRAEAQWGDGEFSRANQGYVAALVMSGDRYVWSGSLIKIADYASMNGLRAAAATFAARSAALLPDQFWKLAQVGGFLIGIGEAEQGIAYLERSLELSDSLESDAAVYADLAEAYKRLGERGKYLAAAREYIETAEEIGDGVSAEQKGLLHFYRGETLAAQGDADGAYQAYELAANLISERFRRSEILMNMAEYQAGRDAREQAAGLAEESVELLPDQDWKLRQAGELLLRVGEREKGFSYLDRSLANAHTPAARAASISSLAEAYGSVGDGKQRLHYAREYIVFEAANANALSDAEAGLSAFYQAEILSADGRIEEAYREYERAGGMVADTFRISDIYMKMAEIKARLGDRTQAAALAERSAEVLPDGWKLRQVGEFLVGLGMPDKALEYFSRYAKTTSSADDHVPIFAIMADAYKSQGNQEAYVRFAGRYIAAVSAGGRSPSNSETGLADFYHGEILSSQGKADQAYAAYERAAPHLGDKVKLSEAFMKMAEIRAERGDKEQAAGLAEQSATALPEPWRRQQVGEFILHLGMPGRAFAFWEQYAGAASAADGGASVYRTMAETYKNMGDREQYLRFAGEYVEAINAAGRAPSADEKGIAAYYEGDILAAGGDADGAHRAYARAAELVSDKYLLGDIHMKMAEYYAAKGNRGQAAFFAEKAADALSDQDWRLQRIGELYNRLEMPEKAIEYFERVLSLAESPRTRALAHAALADTFKKMDDGKKFLDHAGAYVAAVQSGAFSPSREEEALASFYRGEIAEAQGDSTSAYQAYERVTRLSSDKYRLSDAYIRMARYQAGIGGRDLAIDYAERARELLPDQGWRVMEVGDVYNGLELTDKAVEYYRRVVDLTPVAGNRAAAYGSLAEAFKKLGDKQRYIDYARLYVDAMAARGDGLSDNEKATVLFYRGESEAFAGDEGEAYRLWDEAALLFDDKYRLSDIAMKQAEYRAKRGDTAQAAELAEKSAAILPNEAWRQKGTGDFFSDQDMMDKAIHYYERNLELSKTPETVAAAYAALAGAYKKMKNEEKYLDMAREYLSALSRKAGEPTREEKALQGFYLGEILTAENKPDEAYVAYEYAAQFIENDEYRLSDILMIMARYNATRGDKRLAAEQAVRAAGLLPDKEWRIQEVVSLLGDVGDFRAAEDVAQRAIDMNPLENMRLYRAVSYMYSGAKNKEKSLCFNARFIDLLTDKVASLGAAASRDEVEELWNARDRQNGESRLWGLDSYYFGKRWPNNDNYFVGMSHELFRYYKLPNEMSGKMYLQYGGTLKAHYSGYYQDVEDSSLRTWDSRPRLPQTSQIVLGVNLNPFKGWFMSSVSVSAEHLFGTGDEMDDDFRFRFGCDKTVGDKPRPFGAYWKYWKVYSNTVYSTRHNDITSAGDYRIGITATSDRDRNLLIMPHALLIHSYDGKTVDKGQRWGFDVGPGIAIRKWFREDKYNTPRSYIEAHVYYHHALTHDRKNGFGFTLTTSF